MSEIERLHARFCDYSQVFKGNTQATISWFKTDFRLYIRFSGIENITEINRQSIEDWLIDGRSNLKWKEKTIKLRMQSMSLFLDWCVDQKIISENVVNLIPKPKLPKQIPKYLSIDAAQRLLEWTEHYRYEFKFEKQRAVAIIGLFIHAGLRKEELRSLKVNDIDLENKSLIVKSGKGSKDRIVPLNSRIVLILDRYLKEREKMKRYCPFLFTSLRHDIQMGPKAIARLVQKIRDKSGIYFYPHLLRHTFATLMLEGGCDIFSLSKMLGHSDIKTTTIYLSASTMHLKNEIEKHPMNF